MVNRNHYRIGARFSWRHHFESDRLGDVLTFGGQDGLPFLRVAVVGITPDGSIGEVIEVCDKLPRPLRKFNGIPLFTWPDTNSKRWPDTGLRGTIYD